MPRRGTTPRPAFKWRWTHFASVMSPAVLTCGSIGPSRTSTERWLSGRKQRFA